MGSWSQQKAFVKIINIDFEIIEKIQIFVLLFKTKQKTTAKWPEN
jgi:hypothetical protein